MFTPCCACVGTCVSCSLSESQLHKTALPTVTTPVLCLIIAKTRLSKSFFKKLLVTFRYLIFYLDAKIIFPGFLKKTFRIHVGIAAHYINPMYLRGIDIFYIAFSP